MNAHEYGLLFVCGLGAREVFMSGTRNDTQEFLSKWVAKSILGIGGIVAIELKSRSIATFTVDDWITFSFAITSVITSVWLALRDNTMTEDEKSEAGFTYLNRGTIHTPLNQDFSIKENNQEVTDEPEEELN